VPALDLLGHHAAGVDFKLRPVRSTETRETLAARHTELSALARQLWLWLESKRLGPSFASPRDYALSGINKCPETSPLRNRFVNLRAFGLRAPFSARGTRYPRERIFHAMNLLLWEPSALADANLISRLQLELHSDARDLQGLVADYLRLWSRFN
jgi:hypothetical protein